MDRKIMMRKYGLDEGTAYVETQTLLEPNNVIPIDVLESPSRMMSEALGTSTCHSSPPLGQSSLHSPHFLLRYSPLDETSVAHQGVPLFW